MPMFSAKVAALSFRPSGAVNVTLDNGQVWTQYGPEGRVPLRAGDSVTLRPSLFGASVLVGPSGWITKVHLIPANATGPERQVTATQSQFIDMWGLSSTACVEIKVAARPSWRKHS